tara:strand:- start:1687 stop:4809 length:3123 start_codon:yes stop_codon:yes gene_type:complete
MNELTKFLVDGILNEDQKQTIALFGGGFKPPTKGHLDVIINGLRQNPEINKVKIIVGGGKRGDFNQIQSAKIWEIYRNANLIPVDVEIIKASPFKYYKDYLTQNPNDKVFVFIGSREGDEDDQFDVKERSEYVKKYSDNVIPVEVATTGGISGTEARDLFQNNIKSFRNMFPDNLSDDEYNQILKILGKKDIKEGRKKKKDPKKGTGKKPKDSNRRLYTDEDPKDTVGIKFSTKQDIVDTLNKTSFKSKSHARQSQIINLIHQRVRAAYGRAKDPAVKKRLKTGLDYITKKKEASKKKTQRLKNKKLNENKLSLDDTILLSKTLRDKDKMKQIHSLLVQMFPKQKEFLDYNYKNDQFNDFRPFIFYIDEYIFEGPKLIPYTELKLDPDAYAEREKKYKEYIEGKIDKYFNSSNSDPRKVNLSKVPPITIDAEGMVAGGNHRAFLAIKQQNPLKAYQVVKANNTHPNVEKILNIIGRKNQKENIDPKSQAKHKGKSAPFGSAYEPVNEVNLITGKDFGKDKLKEITPIIFLSHDNFKENEIKKIKKDLDSDPYISSRYAGIVLDFNSFKTDKGFDFNKIIKTGNSITNSIKTQYKNKLSKLDPVVYVTYTPKSKQIKDILGNKFLFLNRLDAGDIVINSKLQMRRGADEVTARLGKAFDTSGIKKLNENATYSSKIDYKQQIKDLTKHMIKKGMNILPLPKVIFKHGDQENASQFLGKTAYYNPSDMVIVLYTEGRHPKDIARSFSHEMIHHIQNLENRLGGINTTNTMEDDNLNDIEREAYTKGNMTFRNWTDNKDGEEVTSLNEKIVGEKIECDNCGWSWNIVDGGDDLFICHKCGYDNTPLNEAKPYKHKFGFSDKLGKDPFGLNQYARELVGEAFDEDQEPFVVYCDMDGVLCDFELQFKELTNGISAKEYKAKNGVNGFWKIITDQGEKFWSEMPWTPEGKKLWSYIKKYNPILLSAPSNDPSSRLGKRQWVEKNLPGVTLKLASRFNKPDYATNDNTVLIDDYYGTIVNWKDKGSIGIWYNNYSSAITQLQKAGL